VAAWRIGSTVVSVAFLVCGCLASPAFADVSPGWGRWWLPPDRSAHGHAIDSLFYWIFWITMICFVGVEVVLIIFMIKYRRRPDRRKAFFTHGNTRLEMTWTLAPAVILAGLALGSKKVWDDYRYSPTAKDPYRAKILVIGQQFKWNFVYPGPDGRFGQYLSFPKPYDAKWPVGADGKHVMFAGVVGPASLPYKDAVAAINTYIDQENPLGKDYADPAGKDDNYEKQPGRELILPVNRPIEVQLTSKDVLHDFFLPNFRVKLDAVPGMRGHLYFTATMTSKEREAVSRRKYTVDELSNVFSANPKAEFTITITEAEHTEGAEDYKPPRGARFWRYKDASNATIVRHGGLLTGEAVAKLKAAGVKEVFAYQPGYWDLVCEELCGQGHNTMQAQVVILDQAEYDALKRDVPGTPQPAIPSTAPTIAMN
jgi:cytochrome c oxidase subunit 2